MESGNGMRPRQTAQALAFIRGLQLKIDAETDKRHGPETAVFLSSLSDDLDRFAGEIRGDRMRAMVHQLIVLLDWTVEAYDGGDATDLGVALIQASICLETVVPRRA